MLISQKILDALNQQVTMEFGASLQYDVIASYFSEEALPNLSKKFFDQSTEERGHAHRFMKYIVDAGGHVVISTISAPQSKFKGVVDAVKLSLDQELKVTKSINVLADMAIKEGDHATLNFLQWFIQEQSEEVASMDQLYKIVKRAGEEGLIFVEQYISGAEPEKEEGEAT